MIKIKTILSALIVIVLLVCLSKAGSVYGQDSDLHSGMAAPQFKLHTSKGNVLDLKKLHGKVVIIDFWATWCGPCRMATPGLIKLHKKYAKQGLVVVGISVDDNSTINRVPKYIKENNIPYTICAKPSEVSKVAHEYGIGSIPAQYLIDKKGIIRWSQDGYSSYGEFELENLLAKVLAEK